MNKLQLTKGELTKIILEEVRNLQEAVDPQEQAKDARTDITAYLSNATDEQVLALQSMIAEMESYE
tara:strand:+ start:394 stop:591 length:198 start_codon:yes stop_codon:yes gene_type:complete